jgi:transcriptional regulator with XRE-family HTH domain
MAKNSQSLATLPPEAAACLKRLGERVRAHRMRLGWTVAEMSERLFCAPATYRAIEAGKATSSVGILANALWLLGQLESIDAIAPITPELTASLVRKRRMRRPKAVARAGTIAEGERDF